MATTANDSEDNRKKRSKPWKKTGTQKTASSFQEQITSSS
jgi:hypothetical protein